MGDATTTRSPIDPKTQASPSGKVTPMMVQYHALKEANPGALLFFRMGDFYELFFDDAKAAAAALDIALTTRGKHDGNSVPMCGVPVHSAESYLERLIRHGFKVAICEQLEDPALAKKRGSKSLVRRDVVRVITPGTLTEDSLLDTSRHNYLAALARLRGSLALAWVDISTGDFLIEQTSTAEIAALLARVSPGELLVAVGLVNDPDLGSVLADWRDRITETETQSFDSRRGERLLRERYDVASLDAFGRFDRVDLAAAGALVDYLGATQKGLLPRLDRPVRQESDHILRIDPATRRNLELLETLDGRRDGSLIAAIDRTVTGAGARLLAERLAAPLARMGAINERLAQVREFVERRDLREDVRGDLKASPDLARALSRLVLGRGGPRDLLSIATGLCRAASIGDLLKSRGETLAPMAGELPDLRTLWTRLIETLVESPPLMTRDGGFVREGSLPKLDELRDLRDQGRSHVARLEKRYRDETGIPSLKVRHNNILGYFIEVTSTHRDRVPQTFHQRQGMANASRYSTPELADLERRIADAAAQALEHEFALFEDLRSAIIEASAAIAKTASLLASLDVAAGFAEVAAERDFVEPTVSDDRAFEIERGRHPVVEQMLAAENERFVANDCGLEEDQTLWLLTGPNMAGKSTFLRQNALLAILAQTGSFVPAVKARIGIVDRLFSRVGAADDIARGRSTFMVEMVETATILNQATEASLVILDEIGRGTATYDGLSLAWAVVEHLHEVNRCRGLFATHYHELTALAAKLPRLSAHTVRVREWKGEVVFLHEVASGSADRSYGIHVARLAGLPEAVLERAQEVLHRLEAGEARSAPAELADDLPLFRAAARSPRVAQSPATIRSLVEDRLRDIDPDELTPRRALELLYEFKDVMEAGGEGAKTT